jgi:hypothetical protein
MAEQKSLEEKVKEAEQRMPSLGGKFKDNIDNSHGEYWRTSLLDIDMLDNALFSTIAAYWDKEIKDEYGWSNRRVIDVYYAPRGYDVKPQVLQKEFWKVFCARSWKRAHYDNPEARYEAQNVKLREINDYEMSMDVVDREEKIAASFIADFKLGEIREDK